MGVAVCGANHNLVGPSLTNALVTSQARFRRAAAEALESLRTCALAALVPLISLGDALYLTIAR